MIQRTRLFAELPLLLGPLVVLIIVLGAARAVQAIPHPGPTADDQGVRAATLPTRAAGPIGCVRAWEIVPSANVTNYDNVLRAIAVVSPQDIWAVGDHGTNIQNESQTVILHWDGAQWAAVPSPNPGNTSVLLGVAAVAANDVWAVGGDGNLPLIVHWAGSQWQIVAGPNPGPNSALRSLAALAADNVWAVGSSHASGGPDQPIIQHWDGTQWTVVPSPYPGGYSGLYGVSAVAANDIWAVGGGSAAFALHWDGTQWSQVAVPSPGTSTSLHAISALAADDVWAVGDYYQSGTGYRTLIVHWNGTQWTQLPGPNLQNNLLWGVAAVAPNDVWAVGYNDTGIAQTLTLHWDGTQWGMVSSPSSGPSLLLGVAPDAAGNVWAVGGYSPFTERTLVLRYPPTCLTVTPTPTVTPTRTATRTPTPTRTPSPTPPVSPTAVPCGPATVFTEGFESGTLGAFESVVPTCVPGGCGWHPVTGTISSGLYAAFAPDLPQVSEQRLVMLNPVTVPATADQPMFQFRHRFAFEPPDWDGGTLRYSTNGGTTWNWVPTNLFLAGGYNGDIHFLNPVCPGPGWIGSSNGVFIQSIVDLQIFRGQSVMFSFILGTDYGTGAPGWWIDDVSITYTNVCPTPTPCPACPTATPTGTPTLVLPPSATRSATLTATPTTCPLQFVDVPPGSTFYLYVRCLACAGIVSGYACGAPGEPCPGAYFRPGTNVTRGQTSKIVAEAAGFQETIPSTQQTFQDASSGSTFWIWIERLAGRNVISGYPCGGLFEPCMAPGNRPYFRPNNNVTRGQLAKIVSGAAGWSETPTTQTFEDAPPASTFYLWIERMANRGMISGYPCGGVGEPCLSPTNRPYFRPGNNATRGQMSKIATQAFLPTCPLPARQ